MAVNYTQRIIGLIATVSVVIIVILAWLFWNSPSQFCKANPEACPCIHLLNRVLVFKINIGIIKISSGSHLETNDSGYHYNQCLERNSGDIDLSQIRTSPIGLVAQQWERKGGLKISLRPSSSEKQTVINNLKIEDKKGARLQIMEEWCGLDMKDCVHCDGLNNGQDAVEIVVRLKEGAPLVKVFWSDDWPTDSNIDHKKWELVDNKGNRYLYECQSE